MELKIGDRVKVKEYSDIPESHRNKAMAKMCGEVGVVIDKLYSEGNGGYIYRVKFDNYGIPSNKLWTAEQLFILIEIPPEYKFEFDYLENLVVARFIEVRGNSETEIARGHGHIIHEDALGIAQAASYALKKLYEKMNGGKV